MSKRVFITGIESFTAYYLQQELCAHGFEVFGTVREEIVHQNSAVFACDLNNTLHLSKLIQEIKPDFIVNLAGISFTAHASTRNLFEVNQLGVLSLLEAIASSGYIPQKILLPSSAHVYGNQEQSLLTETCLCKPNSDYALSKFAMEQVVVNFWFQRLPIIIVRPFNYTGLRQSPIFLPPKIVKHFIQKAAEIELGNLNVTRDWSDVRDIASIYRHLLESTMQSAILNVCSGKSYSLQYIIDTMEKISGHSLSVQINSTFVRANEVEKLVGDNHLLQSTIGEINFRPLKETLLWMFENKEMIA